MGEKAAARARLAWLLAAVLTACGAQKAEETTANKVEAPPNESAVKMFVMGAEQLEAGSPKALLRAKELLEKAIALDGRLWEAHYDLGLTLRKLGALDAARASLLKARELMPEAVEPLLALAEVELARGDLDAAAGLLENVLAKDNANMEARLSLSAVNRQRGKLDAALTSAREVLVRNPSEVRALLEVGRIYRAQGEHDVAELVLEKARALNEKAAPVYNELGLLALERGDTQLAFSHFAKAENLDPRFSPAHMNQGSVLLKAGDFKSAERSYRAALEADKGASDARVGLGIALRAQNRHKEALREYELVLSEHPEHLAALFDLAVLKSDFLEQRKEALPLFEKYLSLAPKGDSHRDAAQRYLEDIRMSQGSPK
jgi:tetratricopeptide (TPR) repeat protein